MRPQQILVTSGISPKIIPVNSRGGPYSIIATPAGAGDYDVSFTTTDIFNSDLTPAWVDITAMTGATTTQDTEVGTVTAFRVTLNSGTSVQVDIAQSDV